MVLNILLLKAVWELTGNWFKCIESMVLEQRWTVVCNVNEYNQGKEKGLLLGSQVDCSLNYTLKSCAKIILFHWCKVSTWSCWEWTGSSVHITRNGQGWSTERTDWFFFSSLFLVYISGVQSYLGKLDYEYLKLQNTEQQEVCGMKHRWIRWNQVKNTSDWLSRRKQNSNFIIFWVSYIQSHQAWLH